MEEEEEIVSLPEITPEMEKVIKSAMSSGGQVSNKMMDHIGSIFGLTFYFGFTSGKPSFKSSSH